jgi:NAD(P)-dependent dehydrogenase (short-subunit alcohol dehydrogenase family)
MSMMLKDKVAVVYGGGGSIGSAVARGFAAEGARVFVTGNRLGPVEAVVKDIVAAGGTAEAAEVDGTDEQAIDEHLTSVVDAAGRVDISFNAVAIPEPGIVDIPLVDIESEAFLRPITAYALSYFLTARLAARRMIPNRSGVIMSVTTLHSRMGIPMIGGYGPAQALKESLTRSLSAELGPHGIRVVNLRPQAVAGSSTITDAAERRAASMGMSWEQFEALLAGRTHSRRLMTLTELADAATFLASDRASGFTGTTLNLTMGSLDD